MLQVTYHYTYNAVVYNSLLWNGTFSKETMCIKIMSIKRIISLHYLFRFMLISVSENGNKSSIGVRKE